MTASRTHDGYVIVSGGQANIFGGTSAATPVFAGIIALLNQYYGSNGQGNINPNLYRLAQTNIFHDITTGNNLSLVLWAHRIAPRVRSATTPGLDMIR